MGNIVDGGSWLTGLSVLVLAAAAAGVVSRRVGLPAAIGYIIVGVVVGPFTPGYIADPTQIAFLDVVGSTLLMFVLGLTIDLRAIVRQTPAGIAAPLVYHWIATVIGTLALTAVGVTPLGAVTIALAIAVSSSVVAGDFTNASGGREGLGMPLRDGPWPALSAAAGVVSAIVLIPLLTPIPVDHTRLLAGSAAFGLFLLVLRKSMRLIDRVSYADGNSKLLLQCGIVASLVGAGALLLQTAVPLAAFVVGMVVGDSAILAPERRRVQFRGIFALMFFVAAGTVLDPAAVSRNVAWLAPITLLIASKILLALGLVWLYHLRLDVRRLTVALGPIGEFGVLLVGIGVGAGVVSHDQRSVFLAVATLTIVLFGYLNGSSVYRLRATSG